MLEFTASNPQHAPQFNLSILTKFNPALVCGFDPESSVKDPAPESAAYLAHTVGQWQDMFEAYYYAEHTILPAIQEQGIKNITSQQLLQWLNDLHLRIASTLANDYGVPAGEYTQHYGSRWHNGNFIEDIIYAYLSQDNDLTKQLYLLIMKQAKAHSFLKQIQRSDDRQTMFTKFLAACGVDQQDAKAFLQLLDKVCSDDSIEPPIIYHNPNKTKSSHPKADASMSRFRLWYSDRNPTNQEKLIVNKIVTFMMPPEKIPAAMQDFAEDLLEKWRDCNPNDQVQLADLLYTAFNNLTTIHPYFNGNGRNATCLVNIILVSLGMKSILLRNPNEREDPNSSYSQAIKYIESKPELLINHIKQRVQEAQNGEAYSNPELYQLISLRITLKNTISSIKEQFPNAKVDEFYRTLFDELPGFQKKVGYNTNNKKGWDAFCIQGMELFLNRLDEFKVTCLQQQKTLSQTPSPITTYQYSRSEKKQIEDKIKILTENDTYELKIYPKTELIILLNLNDKEQASSLVDYFNDTKAMVASLKYNRASEKHVVQLKNINVEKLMQITAVKEMQIDKTNTLGCVIF